MSDEVCVCLILKEVMGVFEYEPWGHDMVVIRSRGKVGASSKA